MTTYWAKTASRLTKTSRKRPTRRRARTSRSRKTTRRRRKHSCPMRRAWRTRSYRPTCTRVVPSPRYPTSKIPTTSSASRASRTRSRARSSASKRHATTRRRACGATRSSRIASLKPFTTWRATPNCSRFRAVAPLSATSIRTQPAMRPHRPRHALKSHAWKSQTRRKPATKRAIETSAIAFPSSNQQQQQWLLVLQCFSLFLFSLQVN